MANSDMSPEYFAERNYTLAHHHFAPCCTSFCGAAAPAYGRHLNLYNGAGADTCPQHIETRMGTANATVGWLTSFAMEVSNRHPLATLSLEQPGSNYFWKMDAVEAFLYGGGALKEECSHNHARYGMPYNKPGVFASTLVTVPWEGSMLNKFSIPTGPNSNSVAVKGKDLATAGAHPPQLAADFAQAIVNHHWLRINNPREFALRQTQFDALLAEQMKTNKYQPGRSP